MAEEVKFNDEMVRVELVADVSLKNDCRAYTSVVWSGKGDIQLYPKRLWPKLAAHPDVWKLLPSAQDAADAARKRLQDAAAELAKAQAEAEAAERAAKDESTRKQEAADTNTDAVTATPTIPALEPLTEFTADELKSMPEDDLRALAVRRDYGLHPRLSVSNLVARFVEAQDAHFEGLANQKQASI